MMLVFRYDKTFEGLLTAVFDAYARKTFPDRLCGFDEPLPMFSGKVMDIQTDKVRANRVWNGLRKKLSRNVLNMLGYVWLSEETGSDELLFRYVCKVFNSNVSVVSDFSDADMLDARKIAQKVSKESHYINQFTRFQKAGDDTYFAVISPKFNALPLSLNYFKDRFADQKWLVYDIKRRYGYLYDLKTVTEISMLEETYFKDGKLDKNLMATDEKLFQQLWKSYFKAMTIKERINPKLHRRNLPRRFWKYLTEKQ